MFYCIRITFENIFGGLGQSNQVRDEGRNGTDMSFFFQVKILFDVLPGDQEQGRMINSTGSFFLSFFSSWSFSFSEFQRNALSSRCYLTLLFFFEASS